ncbi:hypothetical protein KKG72_01150 [bacterium]|nr:hypothetical protein [bacterium]MBU1994906.1 hypothetical protein [bacterium]
MDVARYTFESPYYNQVQIGKLDASVKKEEKPQQDDSSLIKKTNEPLQKAQELKTSLEQEVQTSVNSTQLLDVYA